jgi:septum formation topological specificity factor MinE
MDKEQLVSIIKDWVKIDNEMRTLQQEMHKRKTEKKRVSQLLIDIMRNNQIDCFDINNGQILYKKKNVKQPITKSVLLEVLSTYFQGDSDKVNELNNFILGNRKVVTKETIVRKITENISLEGSGPGPEPGPT